VAHRGSDVFRFSGVDGSLARFDVDTDVVSLELVKVGTNTSAVLVGTGDGPVILDKDGNRLWESAYTDWSGAEVGAVRALDDLDRDNTSDLAILFADRILVARSTGASPLGFEAHRSVLAGDNKTIELKELTNDIDGDGVQEIAYFEHDKDKSAETGILVVVSPVSGKVWHQWDMPAMVDLACADFNGDHYLDSVVHRQGKKPQYSMQDPRYWETYPEAKLEVYSGQDNTVLWSAGFDGDWWQPGEKKMPASSVGDVTGDGADDLAVSSVFGAGAMHSSRGHDTHVSVYDIVSNSLVKEVILPPVQKDSNVKWEETTYDLRYISGPGDAMRLAGDLNGDGHQELAVRATYQPIDDHDLALVDLETGQVLGYSTLFDTLDFFETNEDYTLGFAAGGSVYLAKVSSGLRVISPGDGATVGSRVRIAWEGTSDSSLTSVFLDGYENARTSGDEAALLLTPGKHEVVIRSVDRFGIVTYAAVEFRVSGFPWVSILAAISVAALLVLYFCAGWIRVVRNRRAHRGGL
jgi:hypothetical protein